MFPLLCGEPSEPAFPSDSFRLGCFRQRLGRSSGFGFPCQALAAGIEVRGSARRVTESGAKMLDWVVGLFGLAPGELDDVLGGFHAVAGNEAEGLTDLPR